MLGVACSNKDFVQRHYREELRNVAKFDTKLGRLLAV